MRPEVIVNYQQPSRNIGAAVISPSIATNIRDSEIKENETALKITRAHVASQFVGISNCKLRHVSLNSCVIILECILGIRVQQREDILKWLRGIFARALIISTNFVLRFF